MRCPICEQAVLKATRGDATEIWIRCITDGDFKIATDTLVVMSRLPLATRQRVLNVAILDRQLGNPPLVDAPAIAKGCVATDTSPVSRHGK